MCGSGSAVVTGPVLGHVNRPRWDETWLDVVSIISRRSTCPRAQVGAVLVAADNRVLATGYNGAAAGHPHCDEVGCLIVEGGCVRTVHAEVNALFHVWDPRLVIGATLYCSMTPCWRCAIVLGQSGLARVVAARSYRRVDGYPDPVAHLESCGVRVDVLETGVTP